MCCKQGPSVSVVVRERVGRMKSHIAVLLLILPKSALQPQIHFHFHQRSQYLHIICGQTLIPISNTALTSRSDELSCRPGGSSTLCQSVGLPLCLSCSEKATLPCHCGRVNIKWRADYRGRPLWVEQTAANPLPSGCENKGRRVGAEVSKRCGVDISSNV